MKPDRIFRDKRRMCWKNISNRFQVYSCDEFQDPTKPNIGSYGCSGAAEEYRPWWVTMRRVFIRSGAPISAIFWIFEKDYPDMPRSSG